MDLWVVFLTGLTVGGLTCLAVQGGLLTSTIAARVGEDLKDKETNFSYTVPVIAFLITKVVAYTALGFILGLIGQNIIVSDGVRITIQLLAGVYMLAVALNLLNIHPIFRYVIPTPPRFLTKVVRNQSRSKDLFAPAILGAMTIFIPCGTTLAMEALAISTGNPWLGALIMFVFTIGTSPLFFILGFLTTAMGATFKKNFFKLAAILLIYLGVTSINGSLILFNSPLTLQSMAANSPIQINFSGSDSKPLKNVGRLEDQVRVFDILVDSRGYTPNYLTVQKGEKVRFNLTTKGAYTCAAAFRIPELGIAKDLKPVGEDAVEFTPTRTGRITFACSMGMYDGIIEVVESI